MKFYFSIFFMSFFLILNAYSQRFTVNGVQYNGQKFKVYPNSEGTFEIKFTEGNVANIESSNSAFNARLEPINSNTPDTTFSLSSYMNAKIFVKADNGTRINSTSQIIMKPILDSDKPNYPFFEVVLSPVPSIKKIELMTADIKNLQKGLPVRLVIIGTGLDDVDILLPKGFSFKKVKSSDNEMSIELNSKSKSFKGLVIDQNSFKVKSARTKMKFEAKNLDFSTIK